MKFSGAVLRRIWAPILVLCASAAFSQEQKTVGQLVADVKRGDKAALQKLITLGNAGNADAQRNLGALYDEGNGVTKDVVQIANWYRKAAEQGNAIGQYNLGVLYSNGDGVPKDHVEAANWYKKAADQGLAISQYALAWMYANGDGVPTNNIQAFVWWNLAAAQGFIGAKEHRSAIEKMMTRSQIAEAKKLSRERKPKRPNP